MKSNAKTLTAKAIENIEARAVAGDKLAAVAADFPNISIHKVAPVFWAAEGKARPFSPAIREDRRELRKAVRAARKDGARREVVAAMAGISVREVKDIEGKRPVWTGKGTKAHLAA